MLLLTQALVWTLGGFWKLKERCAVSKWRPLRSLYRLVFHTHQAVWGAGISYRAHFATPPVLPHGINGIFVSGDAVIGRDCIIYQQVTIGSNSLLDSSGLGAPNIGDGCLIGAGAKIIGRVKVGNHVRIGANAVVTKDVPDHCVVVSAVQTNLQRQQVWNRLYTFRGRWGYVKNGAFHVETDQEKLAQLYAAFPRTSRNDGKR